MSSAHIYQCELDRDKVSVDEGTSEVAPVSVAFDRNSVLLSREAAERLYIQLGAVLSMLDQADRELAVLA